MNINTLHKGDVDDEDDGGDDNNNNNNTLQLLLLLLLFTAIEISLGGIFSCTCNK